MKEITNQVIRECFMHDVSHSFISMNNGNRITVDHPSFVAPVTMFVFHMGADLYLKVMGREFLNEEMTILMQRHLMKEYDTYLVPDVVESEFVTYQIVYYPN